MKSHMFLFCVIFISVFSNPIKNDFPIPAGAGLNIFEFLDLYDYTHEEHSVVTEDGYILGLHRITSSPRNRAEGPKPVVFLMHGLESSSMDWVDVGPESALGLMLSDTGYDVWLGNNRGNTWSRNHTSLSVKDKRFWDFSFHEIGKYDLSALIDHILETTRVNNLTYVGHSQGTTAFFALTALKPEYNEKINLMVALAPVAYMDDMTNWVPRLMSNPINNLIIGFGIQSIRFYDILPHIELFTVVGKKICPDGSPLQFLCADIIYAVAGSSPQLNRNLLPVFLSNTPAGTSYRQMMHYVQELRSGHFRAYDYSIIKNRKIYKQSTPPSYNVTNIKAPVALFYSENDVFAAVQDVTRFANDLPNVVSMNKIKYGQFSHLDFLWATDLNEYVNFDVINLINKYNNISAYCNRVILYS
ncbi:unnamed protein product [Brassicogethes aeneus]|uniref:Lipase n=1 Tax=Brassicogethes aeneus TaxID=1431903 RepID=A0A9P0BA68_BRAAE|nr:unnamed protein product [Brassicogethes aeneus]